MSSIKSVEGFSDTRSNVVSIRRNEVNESDANTAVSRKDLAQNLEGFALQALDELKFLSAKATLQDKFHAFLAPNLVKPHALSMELVRGRISEIVHMLEKEDQRDATIRSAKAVLNGDLRRLSFLKQQKDTFIEV